MSWRTDSFEYVTPRREQNRSITAEKWKWRGQGAWSNASWEGKQVLPSQAHDTGLYQERSRKPLKTDSWMVSLVSILKHSFMLQAWDYLSNYVSKLRIEWDTADRVWKLVSEEFCLQLWWLRKIPQPAPPPPCSPSTLTWVLLGIWLFIRGWRSLGLHLCHDRFNICLLTASVLYLKKKMESYSGLRG